MARCCLQGTVVRFELGGACHALLSFAFDASYALEGLRMKD